VFPTELHEYLTARASRENRPFSNLVVTLLLQVKADDERAAALAQKTKEES
jgi:hypothetical protein